MASIITRSSVLAVVPEATEGTPVAPSAATQYTALQTDFSMAPSYNVLESDELRSSIGKTKPIIGAESPTASFSHYLKHSGVEGQAPDYNDLLKAFFGTETVNATQRVTAAGSTTAVINVAAATGSDFPRGAGFLIKDGTNGYRIRAVYSRSTDAITTLFNVPTAPASGVSLGKCVYYSPADTDHQTLSLWHYLGNGGARQLLSGGRVTGFDFDATAGELVNANFSIDGLGYYFNPIEITSSTRYLDFTDDDGTWACAVAVKMYKDPHELAEALQSAMRAANSGETATVTYSNTTGKFTIKTTGTVLSLLWNTGANTANTIGTKIGFSVAADDTGAAATTGYTSDNAQDFSSPYTPTLDATDAVAAKYHEVMIGDADDYACFGASSISFSGSLDRAITASLCAESGQSGSLITARMGEIQVTALLSKYDAEWFARLRSGTTTRFQYSFGVKSGGNWVAGYCGYLAAIDCTVSSIEVTDEDGQATLSMTLNPYVASSGAGEMYLGFL